jgi:hypothetical protein
MWASPAERDKIRKPRYNAERLADAMAKVFKHCAMIHKFGGASWN